MDPGPLRDLLTAVAGLFTGALSGAFGVGGAVISTPAIRALGVPATLAIGTTLPSIFPSAAAGALRYRREGLVDRQAVVRTVPVGLVAAVAGAALSEVVPGDGHLLMLLTAALLGGTAVRMARSSPPTSPVPAETGDPHPAGLPRSPLPAGTGDATAGTPDGDPRTSPARSAPGATPPPAATGDLTPAPAHGGRRSPGAFAAVGVLAGLLSGLLGVGGGIVMVPGFTQLTGLPIKSAIATSLVCVAALAVPGTITHGLLGNIDWRTAAFLTVTVIPGARLGAAATVRASDRSLRRVVAGLLGTLAVLYAAAELVSLLG